MDFDLQRNLRINCAPYHVPLLSVEIKNLGYEVRDSHRTDVHVAGSLMDAMRLNLELRTAINVLVMLDDFECRDPDELYSRVHDLAWEEIISPDEKLSVVTSVRTPTISDSRYASLKVKDAVVDRIAARKGRRPNSGSDRMGVVINLYWHNDQARIYLNTSGRKLADRNYRKIPHQAPMQETLAAAVVMAAGYDGSQPLVNPMCGSGTIAIEAALMASGRAPGLLRKHFGFEHVLGFDPESLQELRRKLKKRRSAQECAPIIASDIDEKAVAAARKNAETAGVHRMIDFAVCDFADTLPPVDGSIVLLNPEYGERLGELQALESTYKRIGDYFKQHCAGSTGFVFTGNLDLAKIIGLRASRRMEFQNAKIDCRLLRYELYKGTRRTDKPAANG